MVAPLKQFVDEFARWRKAITAGRARFKNEDYRISRGNTLRVPQAKLAQQALCPRAAKLKRSSCQLTACGNVPPILIRTANAMRLTRWDTIRSVLLPAALPDIFSGIRIGFSLTLIGTILGEMFGSQRGLGYLLDFALPNFFFHITTAYGLLRHKGVPLGKQDFLGWRKAEE